MWVLKTKPLFLPLLVLFFVLHGYVSNYDFIPVSDASILVLIYLGVAVVIYILSWFFYRSSTKSAILTSALLAYHFFFGSIYDGLKSWFGNTILIRYTFIIPVSLLAILALIIFLKKRKSISARLIYFLNILFIVFIFIEGISFFIQPRQYKSEGINDLKKAGFSKNITGSRPDIYFIIADGYSGQTVLNRFGYDNQFFYNELNRLGFHIIDSSRSNYNFTSFSLASILNMQHLEAEKIAPGTESVVYCYRQIKKNIVSNFLSSQGYSIFNYSIFDIKNFPAALLDGMLPTKTNLITAQTFSERIKRDLALEDLAMRKLKISWLKKKAIYANQQMNIQSLELTKKIADMRTTQPKFVYTHLFLPHFPYYYDSLGNKYPEDSLLDNSFIANTNNYIQYLKYSNEKILALVQKIVHSSATPPVIILLGDHGYRSFTKTEEKDLCFYNLAAVLLPSGNYQHFYKGMSAVNMFPCLFNSLYGQKLPLQKDSSTYLW